MYIGIDLGTTFCCIAYKNPKTNSLEVIDNPQKGGKSIPSVVAFKDNEIQYNLDALNTKKNNPGCFLYDSKRFIGRTYENVCNKFAIDKMNFNLVNVNNKPHYRIDFKQKQVDLVPEHISALILSYLKRIASQMLDNIEGCVITVPAHFTNVEREATLLAAELANLNVLQLLNEPSAAAISYGFEKEIKGNILVIDFGGGTLDISIVQIENNKFDVIGYDGDQLLGGRDIDNTLLDYCNKKFQENFGIEHNTAKKRAKLLEKCETAKIMLSEPNKKKTEIYDCEENECIILTIETFEEMCKPYFKRAIDNIERLLKKINFKKEDLKEVVMTGRSSYIPLIQKMVSEFFNGRKPLCYDPEAAIAKGAAIVAFGYRNNPINLLDQVRYPIGILVGNEKPNRFIIIINSKEKIPCSKNKIVYNSIDNQVLMRIAVAEGESEYFDGNVYIGEFILDNLPPKKAGEVSVNVKIDINRSGILYVTATETSTGVCKSKEMKREGNYYKESEKDKIKTIYNSIYFQFFFNNLKIL